MREIGFKITGNNPLLMHNNQMADPLNIYTKASRSFTSKRNRTDRDEESISRIEWEAGLYFNEDGHVAIPGVNLERMLLDAAKKSRNGPKIKEGVRVCDNYSKLIIGETFKIENMPKKIDDIPCSELDNFFPKYFDRRSAKLSGRSTVIRTRPRFDKWSLEFRCLYDEELIDTRTLQETIMVASTRIGLCDYRPRYGTFDVEQL